MELTLKDHLQCLFNAVQEYDIHPVCDNHGSESGPLVASVICSYVDQADGSTGTPSPIEITYGLDDVKRKELRGFLLEEGIQADDVDAISNMFLIKQALSILDRSVSVGLYSGTAVFKAKVHLVAVNFMAKWDEYNATTPIGKSIVAALDKFNKLESKITHNNISVFIGRDA